MKTIVTGANGMIGAHLVRELLAQGHEVRAAVRASSNLQTLEGLDAVIVRADVLQPQTLIEAARGCDVLFHTAAVFAYWGYSATQLTKTAVEGTLNVLRVACDAGIRRVVFTSSSVVLGSSRAPEVRDESCQLDEKTPPPYVTAKAAQEHAAIEAAARLGMETVAVCPTITVGPHDTRLGPSNGIICSYLQDPFKITWPGGCNIVSARDVARGHLLAALHGAPGARYVLGSQNLAWVTIHRFISELCGVPGPMLWANHTAAYLAATAQELCSRFIGIKPLTTRTQAEMVGRYYWYSHTRAAAELGYAPRPARQALAEAIGWLAESPHVLPWVRSTLRLAPEVPHATAAA